MDAFLQACGSVLGILMNHDIFGVPILVWFIISAAFTVIGKFIVGKK